MRRGILLLLWLLPSLVQAGEDKEAAWLELYGGYGAPGGGMLIGRAHKGRPRSMPRPGESSGTRVIETLRALDSEELPDAEVVITVGKRSFSVVTNSHGYIDLKLPPGLPPPSAQVSLQLFHDHYAAPRVSGTLPVFDDDHPGLGVISDVDDTLLDTGVSHKFTLLKNALTRSTWELRGFPDAAQVLSALGQGRPVIYISGSPWGFHSRIRDYFQRTGFPEGPLVLKRFSSEKWTDQMAYKWPHIIALVDALPHRRWILLGDSSEQDPEIYRRLMRERPGQVEATYIHLVTPEERGAPRFQGMKVFQRWAEVAGDISRRHLTQP